MSETSQTSDSTPADSPLQLYRAGLASGEIRSDPVQALAVEKLQSLHHALLAYQPEQGFSGWKARFGLSRRREDPPQGLYLYGGVGRGKSMLMDMFYQASPVEKKRRIHFHDFMQRVHGALAKYRKEGNRDDDPIPPLAQKIVAETQLLCFDEMEIRDIADAMIVGRLFEQLFDSGVVVVATSNRPPRDLYKDGLQRELFLPFIKLLETKMDLLELASDTDYRQLNLQAMDVYLTPADDNADKILEKCFVRLTSGAEPEAAKIPVQGRDVEIPKAVGGVAMVSFEDLCARPLGPADYLEIARRYHTLIIANIPRMGADSVDIARRFVTLIDALYDRRINLICSAAAEPDDLYDQSGGFFEFERTASRMMEMRSTSYIEQERKFTSTAKL